jgi:two-component system cell cycle sensor histidine kinase/response regulator CckA
MERVMGRNRKPPQETQNQEEAEAWPPGKQTEAASGRMEVTSSRQMGQKLEEALSELRTLIQASPLAIIAVDRNGRITRWNPAAQRIFGWTEAEVLGRPDPVIPPENQAEFQQLLGRLLAGESLADLELSRRRQDGSRLDVGLFAAPMYNAKGKIIGAMAVIEDITEAKQVREALRESEEKFRRTFDQAPIGAAIVSLDHRFQRVNAELCRLTGYSEDELTALTFLEITHPEDLADSLDHIEHLVRGDVDHYQIDKRYVRKDGESVWVRLSVRLMKDAQGRSLYFLPMMEDITAHKQAEEALKKSESQYRLLVNQIPAVVYKGYANWSIDFFDDKIETLTGYSKEEFDSRRLKWRDLVLPEDLGMVQRTFIEAVKGDKSYVREYRIKKKTGEICWIQGRGQIFWDAAGKVDYISGVLFDITERKALEAQLMQAQKLEAVGRLAGGVAHDFNNLLMAIMGYGELMRTSLTEDDPHYHYVEDILKATERAASLTQQLLGFSRRQIMQPQVVNLNPLVADMEKMLRRLIEEHIELKITLGPDLGAVKADTGQIGQIIMNLAINARDAMPRGGRLTLETANIEFAASHNCRFATAPPGRYVMLAVSDTGGGMEEATLAHIFEPFFTTKEDGKGTGLGLPMVYGIVKQNHGYIEVKSVSGQGTMFRIYLPRLAAPLETPRPKRTATAKLEGSETILLVEDEEALRTLLGRFFRLFGYNVLEARHGGEAMSICKRHQGLIHLLVTDVVMPRMSGPELADHAARLHPEMKVVYMSGYTDRDLAPYGALDPSKTIIPKPFRPMDLVKKVREFLDLSDQEE